MSYENLPEEEERKYIEELKNRVENDMSKKLMEDESVFKRFIRARNYDVDEAESMLRNHINWRKAFNVDRILSTYTKPEVIEKYIPISCIGYNFDDLPVLYIDLGLDTRGILKVVKKSDVLEFVRFFLEDLFTALREKSKKLNKEIDQFYIIIDFATTSLSTVTHKLTLETIAGLLTLYERHYPERLKAAFCVNTSYYFQLLWIIVRPFLTGRTFQKVWIMSKDYTLSELHKKVNPDILPVFLGGKVTDSDGDPSCRKLLNVRGLVPEEMFPKMDVPLPRIKGAQKISVNRMSKEIVKVIVLNSGYSLEWEFETTGKDIAFALLYKETDFSKQEPEEIIPKQRIETEISPETGLFHCKKRGVYILEFDNSYSWVSSKEVYYKTSVEKSLGKLEAD